ncbi:hypothetical protein ACFQ5F_11540 [Kroppenstedtia eburnea]|uniref:Transposase n=1 Tax=Kroppenstedtia eburnea TaxID=714067 RepID=A0A1N7JZC8_9BACL|nr:hypothetical protein [Kroppenstedtia eburnea]EGK10852.1 transposase [Desmospora sp. 8437]QKI83381.1 hypothetical protein GXN75_16115 [Kroppenstedtia eburnea]SIS54616.1 hypothetical protein SAMN05421790_102366 [Kroppenstedtia eburnea]
MQSLYVREMSTRFSISLLCKIAGVSHSGYYRCLKREQYPSEREKENEQIKAKILECHWEVNGIYGYPRVKIWPRKKYDSLQPRIRRKRKYFGRAGISSPSDHTDSVIKAGL